MEHKLYSRDTAHLIQSLLVDKGYSQIVDIREEHNCVGAKFDSDFVLAGFDDFICPICRKLIIKADHG